MTIYVHIRPQWANEAYEKVDGLFERLKILKIGNWDHVNFSIPGFSIPYTFCFSFKGPVIEDNNVPVSLLL